ncbi:MAG: hypothetical protein M3378_05080 [Actinomycetota bacterium]|nr:hypothetical protein [Actinomycetota bacterium]
MEGPTRGEQQTAPLVVVEAGATDVQGLLEQPCPLFVRELPHRLLTGSSDPAGRRYCVALEGGLGPVAGDIEQVRSEAVGVVPLDGICRESVEAYLLGRAETGLDSVAHEGVHKAMLVWRRARLDEARTYGFVDELQGTDCRELDHRRDDGHGEFAAHDGGGLHEPDTFLRQPAEPIPDGITHRPCDRSETPSRAPVSHRPADLADEERVPAGQGLHLSDVPVPDVAAHYRCELLADRRGGQPPQVDPGREGLSQQPGEQLAVSLLGDACVHEEKEPFVGEAPGDMLEEQQRWLVRPVHIVEHDHQRGLKTDLSQQARHSIELPEPIVGGAVVLALRLLRQEDIRSQPRQVGVEPPLP